MLKLINLLTILVPFMLSLDSYGQDCQEYNLGKLNSTELILGLNTHLTHYKVYDKSYQWLQIDTSDEEWSFDLQTVEFSPNIKDQTISIICVGKQKCIHLDETGNKGRRSETLYFKVDSAAAESYCILLELQSI